ncbi:MAG: NAD(P)-dependent alcohol dehydrogenase [Pseudacidovorax sp.]|nr:NAD(P)-dependent alcohol dehydrogenase [Pseudacidovorax sp.]
MRITAALSTTAGQAFELAELDLDDPRDDEVVVRIAGVGLCHTDVVGHQGLLSLKLPAVFGHEGAGIVERVGARVTKVRPGDAVLMTFMSCGHCPSCSTAAPAYCHRMRPLNFGGTRADGSVTLRRAGAPVGGHFFGQSAFASHALAHERNVVPLLAGMPLAISGALGCGVQTGAGAVMRSLAAPAGSSLVVLGGGSVGLSAVMGGVVQGCRSIVVVEPQPSRRTLALALGATHAIDPAAPQPLADAVRAVLPAGADCVLDTTGRAETMEAGIQTLAPRGRFGFLGIPPRMDATLPGQIVPAIAAGLTFRGITEGDSDIETFLPELMRLHLAGRLPFDRLVQTYPLAQIDQALADQHAGRCVKAVLIP